MRFKKAHLVYFSPTSTSKQIAEAIVHGTGIEDVCVTNLTCEFADEVLTEPDSLTVIAVPVYGGKVAPLAMKRLEAIWGQNSPVVLIVLYGNRAYEKALEELAAFAAGHQFKIIAAATFVGEHSYSSVQYPIAEGRPDTNDLCFAEDFGQKIAEKVIVVSTPDELLPVDVRAIRRPKQSVFILFRYMKMLMALRKSKVPVPKTPVTDAGKCVHCGICVKSCPGNAIKVGDELHTLPDLCIKCCACVKNCPQQARDMNSPMAPLLSKYFDKPKQPQVLL